MAPLKYLGIARSRVRTVVGRAGSDYIDEEYKRLTQQLLNEVREQYPEEYPYFLKIYTKYIKEKARYATIYSRLTRLRTVCNLARELFGKPLTQLNVEEWEALSAHIYTYYSSRDSIVSVVHPLRLLLTYLGYSMEKAKELFPYPSAMQAKASVEDPPPYVPGHVLDKVVFAIEEDVYRALFCLVRITGCRIEEAILLRRENIRIEENDVFVKFNVTKTGISREIPLNWPGFEKHLSIFLTWYHYQHPKTNDPKAWLFPRRTDPTRPVARNTAYVILKKAAKRLATKDPEVAKYLEYIHPHQFRHTRAYELVMQNWNVRWIMNYLGWKKVDMVLRYTRAFEIKHVHRMLTHGERNAASRTCPRCGAVVPQGARFCPSCGLRLVSMDVEELMQIKRDKEKLRQLLIKLFEELGIDRLKELLIT